MPMPDRVEVNVIDVPGEIVFVAQHISQKRRCQIRRSPFRKRLVETPSYRAARTKSST